MAASTVRLVRGLYVLFLICFLPVLSLLNLDELNEMKYNIQILPDPVVLGQVQSEEVMIVSNKYKQLYECRLPVQAIRFQQEPLDETDGDAYPGPGVLDLLETMRSSPCLVKTKDWWTYEFCYGQYVKQYHLEDSEIKGAVLFLGYYDSDFDWNSDSAKASKQHKLKRYHSQSYVNGSKCDLTGESRETEVRFLCEEDSGDYIARVDEPQSCRYVITVHSTRVCQHPLLRPPATSKPLGVVCQPALSPQQYMDYIKAQVSDTKRKVEQISEELKNLDEILAKDEIKQDEDALETMGKSDQDVEEQTVPAEHPADTTEHMEATTEVGQNEESVFTQQNEALADGKMKTGVDTSELMNFLRNLKEGNKADVKKQSIKNTEEQPKMETDREEVMEAEDDDDDELLLQEFKEKVADISVPTAKIEEIKEEMQKEFENIIDEAQQELESEGLKGEFDRSQATQTLETTLEKLLDHIEDKEYPESRREAGQEGTDPTRSSSTYVPRQPDHTADDPIKIRVTKYKPGSDPEQQLKVQKMNEGDPQLQQIKEMVKEQLEKAGLKAEGKIEVKILTRRNVEEAGDQWLTEEDTKSFRELIINLLSGGTEEVYKEQKRQEELENNYRFVWGENQEEKHSLDAAESEELDF